MTNPFLMEVILNDDPGTSIIKHDNTKVYLDFYKYKNEPYDDEGEVVYLSKGTKVHTIDCSKHPIREGYRGIIFLQRRYDKSTGSYVYYNVPGIIKTKDIHGNNTLEDENAVCNLFLKDKEDK